MFRRKKQRVIGDWAALQDALIGHFDATENGSHMEMWIVWKAEKRKQRVRAAYAPVKGLGPVLFVTAPIGTPSPQAVSFTLAQAAGLLSGGVSIDQEYGELALRLTLPFVGMPFDEIASAIRQLAASADELSLKLARLAAQ